MNDFAREAGRMPKGGRTPFARKLAESRASFQAGSGAQSTGYKTDLKSGPEIV